MASGQIDFAGNYVANIQSNYLAKSADNHTWLSSAPYFSDNNVVSLFLNTTKAPLNDPAVRQAISYGINRPQLNVQGETGYEPPVTTTSGLLLPNHQSYPGPVAGQQPARRRRQGQGQLHPHGRRLEDGRRQVDQERPAHHASRSPTRSRTATTTPTPS